MEKLVYLLIGWVLGLIGPVIVEAIKTSRRKREVAAALRIELEELQYRLAAASYMLITKQGRLDKAFVNWALPFAENYKGNEPNAPVLKALRGLALLEETKFHELAQLTQIGEGVAFSLKTQQANFLETHLTEIAKMPIAVQRTIHEFRNQLHQVNEEIPKIDALMMMTFNSGMSDRNREIVADEVKSKTAFVQFKYKLAADKISAILAIL